MGEMRLGIGIKDIGQKEKDWGNTPAFYLFEI